MRELKVELPEPRRIKARDVFLSYMLDHHVEELIHLLKKPLVISEYAIHISFMPLMQQHVEVAEALLSKPDRLLPVLSGAVVQAQINFFQTLQLQLEKDALSEQEQAFSNVPGLTLESLKTLSVKENVHPRLIGVPCPAETRVPRSADVGLLLCFSGTVVRATAPRLLRHTLLYTCDTCAHLMHVKADHDQYYSVSKPQRCSNPHLTCYSKNFSSATLPDAAHTADYQEVKLQELMSGGGAGGCSIPHSVWVTLHHDLVDSCKPGDDVLVCGSVVRRWKPTVRDARPGIEVVIRANHITVRNKQEGNASIKPELEKEFEEFWRQHRHQPLVARDLILASVCPQMYGLYLVKLAVAVVLCGGVQRVDRGGSRVRGEPHLLLVGDPGTGKSQLLQWACSAGSRAVLTTGIGSTAAGLTVAAVREPGGDWGLEAGALVLADGGVCCIDEFSSVREADRAAIHEAMEQQTISVAKAGMVCKLNSRCSVVAATNPKGRYDLTEPLNLNVGVASPLLSRFDLILVLLDTSNPDWDQLVSNYILSGGGAGRLPGVATKECLWRLDKMRAYFRYARRFQPRLSAAADAVLSRFYQMQRSSRDRDQSRTTIRLLESLVRLSQGHARLMLHREVLLQDAVVAVGLWEAAMAAPATLHPVFERQQHASYAALHAGFPIDPTASYRQLAENLLRRLQLEEELQEELARLDEEDRLSSAEHLAAILGVNSSPGAPATAENEPVPVFRVPGTTVAHASSVPTNPGSLRDAFADTQARRHPTYLSCATQEARRRDLIEELEDVAPEMVRPSNGRTSNKKGVRRKKKDSSIEKYFKNNVVKHRKKQKTVASVKKKKEVFVTSSESESNSSASESNSDSSPSTKEISRSDSYPTISASKTIGVECERPKPSESLALPSESKSDFCSEELASVSDDQSIAGLSGSKPCEAVPPKPNSGLCASELLSESTDRPTILNNRKEEESLSISSPVTTASSLSKKIVAKRKKPDESPFCVNSSIKRARVSKLAEYQLKCKSKIKCDTRDEIRGSHGSSSGLKNSGQSRKKLKAENDVSSETRQTLIDARKENSITSKKNISELNVCAIVSFENSRDEEMSITGGNCDATSASIVMGAKRGDDRATNNAECEDDTATNSDERTAANSDERGNYCSMSQKARSFLKQYAFPNEKNLRKSKNLIFGSSAVANKTVEQSSELSAVEYSPIDNFVLSRFEKPLVKNNCDVGSSVSVADQEDNLGDPEGLVDPVGAGNDYNDLPDTSLTPHFFQDKPSPKASSSITSKLNRFAFVPKAPRDESSTDAAHDGIAEENLKNVLQENVTPRNDHVRNLRTEKGAFDVVLNNDDRIQSSTTLETNSRSETNAHDGELFEASKRTAQDVQRRKNSVSNKLVNLESAGTCAAGRSLTNRLCFDLGAEGKSAKVNRKFESSVRKSLEKFTSSQDLDEDFDF